MMIWAPIAVVFVVLHAPGGIEIEIAPGQVTSLRDPPAEEKRGLHFPPEANCLIGLTDGKAVPVVETCDTVHRLFEQHSNNR